MKNQTIINRIIASILVFFVIMAITLFALIPFGETLFADEKIANLIIFGIPACVALLHFFYVPNVGSGSSLSDAVTSVTTNRPSLSFIIAVVILVFLFMVYLSGPVLFKLFG